MQLNTPQRIEHFRLALLRVLLVLFKTAGLEPGTDRLEMLPRGVKFSILRVLRQAETSARRLVFAESEKLDDVEYAPRPKREKSVKKRGQKRRAVPKKRAPQMPRFKLTDSQKFFEELYPNRRPRRPKKKVQRGGEPVLLCRIGTFGLRPDFEAWSTPLPVLTPDDPLSAVKVSRRMQALHNALLDLPAQAHRMKREIAKRKAAKPGPGSVHPMRTGKPPGFREYDAEPEHEVDNILYECHYIAFPRRSLFDAKIAAQEARRRALAPP